jgi:uncharacterized phage protein gp47/JayE
VASQADLFARVQSYVQALNPQLQVARGGVLWDLLTAVSMSLTDTQSKTEAAAQQAQLATATGDALTAKAADFGVYRIPAVAATAPGVFTVATANPNVALTFPIGSIVQTTPQAGAPAIAFATLAAATIPAGNTTSASVTVQAVVPGAAGNVASGTITAPIQASAGVRFSNTSPATGGADAETDAALRSRTLGAIAPANSPAAIAAAAKGVPGIFAAVVVDAQDGAGNYTVYASDAAGNLSGGLTSAVTTAIAAVDGIGLNRHVAALTVLSQAVAGTLVIASGYTWAAVQAAAQNAIAAYMGALQPGAVFHPSDLTQVLFGSLPGTTAIPGAVAFYPTTPAAAVVPTATQLVRLSGTATLTQGTN